MSMFRCHLLLLSMILLVLPDKVSLAHPGSAIAVTKDGIVYFVDTGKGVFTIQRDGRLVRHDGPAFHWFALDPDSRFRDTPWPALPNAETRSAGSHPTVILSSDFPVTIGSDGKFYYADGTQDRVRIIGIDTSGATSVRATLPPMRRGGETIKWLNGLATGNDGSLYFTEDHAIRKIDSQGQVATVVENVAVENCSAIPGMGSELMPNLRGLAAAADGTVIVAASGCGAVLRVDGEGRVKTVLTAEPPWSPTAVALAGTDIYVLEYLHTASDDRIEWVPRIRKLNDSGTVALLPVNTRE